MSPDSHGSLSQQVKQHLAALKAAGIEFIPRPAVSLQFPEPAALAPTAAEPVPIAANQNAALSETATHAVPESLEGRRHALQLLAKEIEPCSRCPELFSTRTQTVFGVGKLEPDICFVGEAPGADEDAKGEPFVGRAGQLLNKIIAACGYKREDVYVCNILKCRPPNNRTPAPDECSNCREYLERQVELVKPKYMVALGGVAAQNLLNVKTGIMRLRGKVYQYRGIPLICTLHPSYLLRNESAKKDCWDDMKMLLKLMGKPIPNANS